VDNTAILYTIDEFCEAVRISRRSYFRLRAEGEGPRLTILGGKHLVSKDETRRKLGRFDDFDRVERALWGDFRADYARAHK